MSWSRALLALVAFLGLLGCGFTPVYGPGGSGGLANQIALPAPQDRNAQLFQNRIGDRLGYNPAATLQLDTQVSAEQQGLGTTTDGQTTLYQLVGAAEYSLRDTTDGEIVAEGRTEAFTSYSASGSTVATLTAERDATARLMVILADQTIDLVTLELAARGPR